MKKDEKDKSKQEQSERKESVRDRQLKKDTEGEILTEREPISKINEIAITLLSKELAVIVISYQYSFLFCFVDFALFCQY